MPQIAPDKLKKFASKKNGKGGLAKLGKKHDDDKDDEHDEEKDEHEDEGAEGHGDGGGGGGGGGGEHGHQNGHHEDPGGDDDDLDDDDDADDHDDHDDGHGGGGEGGSGGGFNLKKAEQDAQEGKDHEIENALADHDGMDDNEMPAFIADEATWAKAKKLAEPKWDEYDEPVAVATYLYKQLGGKLK